MTDQPQDAAPAGEVTDDSGPVGGRAGIALEALRLASRSDAFTSGFIFGPPIERGGVVVIPLGRMRGGGGGGRAARPETAAAGAEPADDREESDLGVGAGWGVDAKALGAIVIRGDRVRYLPAVDVTRIVTVSILGMAVTAILAPRMIRAARGHS